MANSYQPQQEYRPISPTANIPSNATLEEFTDADVLPKPPLKERKVQYIAHLKTASASAQLVSAADKLHNARAILMDYRSGGEQLRSRFNGGREGTLWYYRAVLDTLCEAGSNPVVDELERVVSTIQALARQHAIA